MESDTLWLTFLLVKRLYYRNSSEIRLDAPPGEKKIFDITHACEYINDRYNKFNRSIMKSTEKKLNESIRIRDEKRQEQTNSWFDKSSQELTELSVRELVEGDEIRAENGNYADTAMLEISRYTRAMALSNLALIKSGIEKAL